MSESLVIIGVPSSAGAYAPGQEKAPAALRAAGLPERLSAGGISVDDRGDIAGFRWRTDKAHPRAMNANAAATVARATADRVASALADKAAVLVLGGDCTVELGTVAGALRRTQSVGVVYIDLDTDLNTPDSTQDGALDWMGVAHMLGIDGTVPELVTLGPRVPMLRPQQVHYFANDNIEPFEREVIERLGIAEVRLAEVAADPPRAGEAVAAGWARQFERLLIHLDVDVLDFRDMPLAENTRRNVGLRFDQLMAALRPLLCAPNWSVLTVCELNPDHGESDGSTVRRFAESLADALAASPRWQNVRGAGRVVRDSGDPGGTAPNGPRA
jgi:arginase